MGIQTGGEGGQNSHGEADAGPQRVAAVRMTVRAAAEVFMVPGAEAAGDASVVSGSSAGMLCSSGRPFKGRQGSRGNAPPSLDWGSFHNRHQTLAAVINENTQNGKEK